jgi:hypothetical protein
MPASGSSKCATFWKRTFDRLATLLAAQRTCLAVILKSRIVTARATNEEGNLKFKFTFAVALFLWFSFKAANAQSSGESTSGSQVPAITVPSNLVLVPVLVKTKGGKI